MEKLVDRLPNTISRSHRARAKRIFKQISKFACLKGWIIGQYLGVGTIGTVFEACNEDGSICAAIKMCELTTADEVRTYEQEVHVQTKFASLNIGPRVFDNCTVKDVTSGRYYTVIIMEKMGQELDDYLTSRRTNKELDHIISQLKILFSLLEKNRVTHGDLALFNIAFDENNTLKFIDYDRASTSVYDPETDIYRLQSEFYDPTDTENTKPIDEYNRLYILDSMLILTNIIKVKPVKDQHSSYYWYKHYITYCKKARIACLGDDEEEKNEKKEKDEKEKKTTTIDLSDLRKALELGHIIYVQHKNTGETGVVTKVTDKQFAVNNNRSTQKPSTWYIVKGDIWNHNNLYTQNDHH